MQCPTNDEAFLSWFVNQHVLLRKVSKKKMSFTARPVSQKSVRCVDMTASIEYAFFHCAVVRYITMLKASGRVCFLVLFWKTVLFVIMWARRLTKRNTCFCVHYYSWHERTNLTMRPIIWSLNLNISLGLRAEQTEIVFGLLRKVGECCTIV